MMNLKRRAQLKQLGLARSFLDRHYKMPVTIEQLSHEAALSPYHFIRLFRRVYKQTPHQYLIQRRIEAAKQLLHSTELSITEICIEIGFESLGSFSTLFRKATGLSPPRTEKNWRPDSGAVQFPYVFVFNMGSITRPIP